MSKLWQIIVVLGIVTTSLFLWVNHERQSAKNEIIVEKQNEIIEIKNETIQVVKKSKTIAKSNASLERDALIDKL
jgi:hypothetical protein